MSDALPSPPRYRTAPPPLSHPIILPVDVDDVFRVGPKYKDRWFQSQVPSPEGVLAWVNKSRLRRYAKKLCEDLTMAGKRANLVIYNGRYILDGPSLSKPPTKLPLDDCKAISLLDLCRGMATRLDHENEMQVLEWVEFFQSHAPVEMDRVFRLCPRLKDLSR